MHDIRAIRENPAAFDAAMKQRGLAPQSANLLELDAARRADISQLQVLQEESNALAKSIGAAKAKGEDITEILAKSKEAKARYVSLKEKLEDNKDDALTDALLQLPNVLLEDVPEGNSEDDNVEIRRHGTPKQIDNPTWHDDLGVQLGGLDFEKTAAFSGARFMTLQGQLAKLERALIAFFLDQHTDAGFTEISPPLLVRDQALLGTSQLPKFEEDLFKTTDGRYLIPTAEVPLTNLVREQILDSADLPLRFTAFTPCFRSEAGSSGKDTKGMVRLHQFAKVEMVSIVPNEAAGLQELEFLTSHAEKMLQLLELPYRTVTLCSGDTGFGARKTYDIEVWVPAQDTYREISSCSYCGEFQARRMHARHRPKGEKQTQFVHTLNGSALAVGRTMVAILENYQQPDGSVAVPNVLQPYMGGLKVMNG